ncbi:MAG TPA: hypothetical protein VJB14_08315 [Planctomycetota bacterium]|nr:hypothetical protein [Planctomycetota bacterium]
MRLLALLLSTVPLAAQGPPAPPAPPVAVHSFQPLRDDRGRQPAFPWHTWVMDLENKSGRDLELSVRIEDEGSRVAATRREALPRAARKRLFFYLPVGGWSGIGGRPKYVIRDTGGRKLKDGQAVEETGSVDPRAYQMGLFSSDKASSNAFGIPPQVASQEVSVTRLTPALFPGRWNALAGFDAILLHDAPLDELAGDQAQALADYVRNGGTVILSPGPDAAWFSHRVLANFVSIRSGSPTQRTGLESLSAAFGPFRRGDPFLFHPVQGGREIGWKREVVSFEAGFGSALVLPFDIRRPPFDSWGGTEGLWLSLLSKIPRRFQEDASALLPASTAESRLQLLGSMGTLINPYPSFFLLLALAVLFLAAVGPVNYLVLRKMGMTILIVVTVPAISIAFLGIVLGTGYVLKGTSTVAYSARFLTTRSGLDCARETQLFTLFSPSSRTYEVAMAPGTHGLPYGRLGWEEQYRYRDREQEPIECKDGAAFAYTSINVGQWESWTLEARAVRALDGGVHFETAADRLKITNLSSYPIRRGLYVEHGNGAFAFPFGEVAAGKTLEVAVLRDRYRPLEDLGFGPESFGGRMLAPTFDPLMHARRREVEEGSVRRRSRALVCLLDEGTPTVVVDARLSGESRSLTLLHVADREEP